MGSQAPLRCEGRDRLPRKNTDTQKVMYDFCWQSQPVPRGRCRGLNFQVSWASSAPSRLCGLGYEPPSLSLSFLPDGQGTGLQACAPSPELVQPRGPFRIRRGLWDSSCHPRGLGNIRANSLWVVALAGPELNTCATGARTGAEGRPGTPVAVPFEDVRRQPDAVSFKAVLEDRSSLP